MLEFHKPILISQKYKPIDRQFVSSGDYKIVPIRMNDRYDIMQWRNDACATSLKKKHASMSVPGIGPFRYKLLQLRLTNSVSLSLELVDLSSLL